MDEEVDVVNEQNEVVGTVMKKEAHAKGLLHRCVVAEVIDSQGRWTLVQQASDRQDAGQFVSPVGGHIQAGESYEDALKREAFEEMGLRNFTYKYVGKIIYNREVLGRKENHFFVQFEIYSDEPPKLNHEAVDFRVFTEEELKAALKETPEIFGDAFMFVLQSFYPDMCIPSKIS